MKIRKIFKKLYGNCSNNLILLLIWARQVWKTTLLKQLRDKLKEKNKTYFLNLEDTEIKNLLNKHPNKLFEITWSSSDDKQVIFLGTDFHKDGIFANTKSWRFFNDFLDTYQLISLKSSHD